MIWRPYNEKFAGTITLRQRPSSSVHWSSNRVIFNLYKRLAELEEERTRGHVEKRNVATGKAMCKPRTHPYVESRDNMNWCQISGKYSRVFWCYCFTENSLKMYQNRETHVQTGLAVGLAWKQDLNQFLFRISRWYSSTPSGKTPFYWGMGGRLFF